MAASDELTKHVIQVLLKGWKKEGEKSQKNFIKQYITSLHGILI